MIVFYYLLSMNVNDLDNSAIST